MTGAVVEIGPRLDDALSWAIIAYFVVGLVTGRRGGAS